MATSSPFHQVAQQWNVVTGETNYPFCTNLVWTLFPKQHCSIPWAQSDDIAGESSYWGWHFRAHVFAWMALLVSCTSQALDSKCLAKRTYRSKGGCTHTTKVGLQVLHARIATKIFHFLLDTHFPHWLIDGLMDGWMDGWIDGLMDWWIDGLMGWWVDGLMDWWIDGLMDWWIDGLMDWWIDGLMDWWIDGLMDWWIDGLMDWLIDWLIDWFFFLPFSRRRSLVDDCFTGHSPGSAISIPAAPDVHEGLGQIQASAP